MNELKDKDLREALSRREARRTKPEVPADFCDGIMQEIAPKQSRRPLWRWVAVAASLLLLIGIGVALVPFNKQTEAGSLIVQRLYHPPRQSVQPQVLPPSPSQSLLKPQWIPLPLVCIQTPTCTMRPIPQRKIPLIRLPVAWLNSLPR